MSFQHQSSSQAVPRIGRDPWPTEPELPPDPASAVDPGARVDRAAVRATLTKVLDDTVAMTGELESQLAALGPMLVREPSTETTYIAQMHRLEAAKQTVAEVKSALQRLDDGTYGWCATCLEPIPAGRLELRPQAGQCVQCL